MILYLTSSNKVNLLDFIETELELPIKKLIGSFSLNSFVVKDMRFYSHVRYLAIERGAIKETNEEMIQALLSFQMMYEMRVIVISEGLPESSPFFQGLLQANVPNVVTAEQMEIIKGEIRECFSELGMHRKNSVETLHNSVDPQLNTSLDKVEQYHFTCSNFTIAIAGCDRRVGVTTTAFNLVCWINAHGGTACYVEANSYNHLAHIVQLFKPEQSGNAYVIEDSDFYFTNELNRDYNFIIVDCGIIREKIVQEDFRHADIRLLCSSAMPYELVEFYRVLERCKDLSVKALGIFVPENIKPYLSKTISPDIIYCNRTHDLFDAYTNGDIFKILLNSEIKN
ncbi:hypothetical protein Q0V21_05100 [Paenibacillus sp. 11B]|uniref:hypothetical protein n=1 Tax=Paenibacillus sp. 11B TaxID=3060965 RepID=UPI0026554127|nr:hypothetical protein [Paenibacillus sp. 11B]MDN8588145.1 hypothetical protein [Paenibacillus sp. 11B]